METRNINILALSIVGEETEEIHIVAMKPIN
jgi:hypothetical protein